MSGSLTPEDRRRLEELFDRAADLPTAARAPFVEAACGTNDALKRELSRLLQGLESEDVLARLQTGEPLPEGTRIGPYELRERIGEGGMGEVYEARQLEPVIRRVALKVIKRGMDSDQVVARFEGERQALARMSHPNVAQVFDGGTTPDGRPYFVMELVEGATITDHSDRRGLSTRARVRLFLDICDGVQHAHQKGIIHRDLKPSNLLVAEPDGRAIPKVIDFGVARATSGNLAERSLHTMIGQLVGTLDYMSPEQADPTQQDIDTRSDVYSLGVVLYQLVSGLLPFEHSSAVDVPLSEVQRAIRELDPPTPSTRLRRRTATAVEIAPRHGTDGRSLIRQVTGDLDWITMKALEKDPARRYASAAALADDLRRHLAHEPVLAGRPSALYRTRKYVRRHRVGVTAGALIAAALVAGIAGIVSGRLAAENRAAELLRLSDGYRLRQIEAEADELWPAHPSRIGALESLRDRAEQLTAALDWHRATLDGRAWDVDSTEDRWQQGQLSELIDGIERLRTGLLENDAPSPAFGWSLAKRLEVARELEARFAVDGDAAAAWRDALPRIRDAYPGLDLAPQVGLLPLGPDPDAGLWEFAHLLSGAPAQRDPDSGKLVLTEETGLVLVLLPGGTFRVGAQRDDPDQPNFDPVLDPEDARSEGPVHEWPVAPFFLSKYEMNRSQWARFGGSGPNPRRMPNAAGERQLLPVVNVSLTDCERTTRRLGLTLPDEEQWEYAARAGTDTPWWTGAEESGLEGTANLFDRSLDAANPRTRKVSGSDPVPWSDDAIGLSAVGSFGANPFGLHDVHGNVAEWCFTHRISYSRPRPDERSPNWGVCRGGIFTHGSYFARITYRGFNNVADFRHHASGLRPVRALDP